MVVVANGSSSKNRRCKRCVTGAIVHRYSSHWCINCGWQSYSPVDYRPKPEYPRFDYDGGVLTSPYVNYRAKGSINPKITAERDAPNSLAITRAVQRRYLDEKRRLIEHNQAVRTAEKEAERRARQIDKREQLRVANADRIKARKAIAFGRKIGLTYAFLAKIHGMSTREVHSLLNRPPEYMLGDDEG